ncbi:MAG: hypothetical protein ABI333_09835 [bacterium]
MEKRFRAARGALRTTPPRTSRHRDLVVQLAALCQALAHRHETPAKARQWRARARKHYLSLADDPRHRGYKRMDEVLYQLGVLAMQEGANADARRDAKGALKQRQAMLKHFGRLLKEHPRSRYLAWALLARGDFYFHVGQYKTALGIYSLVRRLYLQVAPYAMYKLGWSLFRLKRYQEALVELRASTRSSRSARALIEAARGDIALVGTYAGLNGKKALRYFRNTIKGADKSAGTAMFLQLARTHVARDLRPAAIRAYRYALGKWRHHRDACVWVRTLEGLIRR